MPPSVCPHSHSDYLMSQTETAPALTFSPCYFLFTVSKVESHISTPNPPKVWQTSHFPILVITYPCKICFRHPQNIRFGTWIAIAIGNVSASLRGVVSSFPRLHVYASNRRVYASPRLGVSASPRLRVSASPRLRVCASARLRVCASPRLRVSASPRLRVSASPRLRVSASPRLRVSASPRLRVSASLRLCVSASLRLCFYLTVCLCICLSTSLCTDRDVRPSDNHKYPVTSPKCVYVINQQSPSVMIVMLMSVYIQLCCARCDGVIQCCYEVRVKYLRGAGRNIEHSLKE